MVKPAPGSRAAPKSVCVLWIGISSISTAHSGWRVEVKRLERLVALLKIFTVALFL